MALRRSAFVSLLLAAVLSLAVLAFAVFYPAYSGVEGTSDGTGVGTSQTMVEQNGWGVLIPFSIPLAATILVWACLTTSPRGWGRRIAWVLVGLLFVFAVLGMATIGVLFVPIAVALAFAAAWPAEPAQP